MRETIDRSVAIGMEDCNLSLAVDCTLSLGSTTSRGEIPARLSRAGSPDQDLTWSLAVRSDPSRAHTCEQDRTEQQAMSWRGSCDRSDPLEYFPQVSGTERRGSDSGPSKGAWPRSTSAHQDGATTSKASLFSLIKNSQRYSNRASRQPWLSHYIASSAKAAASQCIDTFVRVCAHCGTSKTPLWRNGPGGPKSLCNACGIRFKKAGRRSAANGSSESPPASPRGSKREVADEDEPYWEFPPDARPRKRSSGAVLSGSCVTWQALPLESQGEKSSSYSSDEEEGAALLMALSCGVVNA